MKNMQVTDSRKTNHRQTTFSHQPQILQLLLTSNSSPGVTQIKGEGTLPSTIPSECGPRSLVHVVSRMYMVIQYNQGKACNTTESCS